jgi:Mrp family chromosome partitioning ATPase
MAPRIGFGRKKRSAPPLDEFGGTVDGGLAIIDDAGRLVHMTPPRVAGAMRYFLARVQLHDAQGLPERLALTSALIGEGVTYVTRSLAAAIAYDTDASVVIVDLTFRRPGGPAPAKGANRRRSVKPAPEPDPTDSTSPEDDDPSAEEIDADARAINDSNDSNESNAANESNPETPARPTLADAIESDARLDDIIIPTSNPRLSMIQAGGVPVARRPALAQGRPLASLLDQLDERFDHVLLDLPPVLASSDAMNLAQLADAYVRVVRQGSTSEGQVEAAIDELQGGETLGVILNRFDSDIPRRLRRLVGT